MGIFEFILLIALISTIGKVLTERRRPLPPPPPDRAGLPSAETERMRQAMDDLSERVGRLEEERDFYRELLEHPGRRRAIEPGPDDPGSPS